MDSQRILERKLSFIWVSSIRIYFVLPFAASDDYFRMSPMEHLASRSDKVYDFYYSKGQLYLLIRRLSLIQDRVVSRSELVHFDVLAGFASIHTGPYIFLSFDQMENIFKYSADNDSYRINIFPLKDLKWESLGGN